MTVLQLLSSGGWPVHADDPVLSPDDLRAVQHAATLARQQLEKTLTQIFADERRLTSNKFAKNLRQSARSAGLFLFPADDADFRRINGPLATFR